MPEIHVFMTVQSVQNTRIALRRNKITGIQSRHDKTAITRGAIDKNVTIDLDPMMHQGVADIADAHDIRTSQLCIADIVSVVKK